MRPDRGWLLGFFLLIAGCHRDAPPASVAHPHYELGTAWKGVQGWFYPSEQFDYRATGIATRERAPADPIVADGEVWSAEGMTGSHQTLQLPSVVTVRNLLNGHVVRVRLTRRGPEEAGRVVALSPKAADLLGMTQDAPVEVVEDEQASHALAEGLNGAAKLDVASAPVGRVQAEALDGSGGPGTMIGGESTVGSGSVADLSPLAATWRQGAIEAGRFYVFLGRFSGYRAAAGIAARCSGAVEHRSDPAGLDWRVRSGPYGTIADADAALDRSRACGVEGARIIVE